jgi:hypothetical protein
LPGSGRETAPLTLSRTVSSVLPSGAAVPRWRIKKPLFYIVMLVLLLGVYAVRMVLFFPHTEPMNFESASLLDRVLKFFQ